jgi:hypothetical protein
VGLFGPSRAEYDDAWEALRTRGHIILETVKGDLARWDPWHESRDVLAGPNDEQWAMNKLWKDIERMSGMSLEQARRDYELPKATVLSVFTNTLNEAAALISRTYDPKTLAALRKRDD